jgi:hypothetical protein
VRWVLGLGSLAIGVGAAVVVACGGSDLTMCGAGTVNVGGVCVVATDDGSVLDTGSPDVDSPDEGLPPDDSGSDGTAPIDASTPDVDAGPPNRCPYGKGPVMAEIPNTLWDAGTFCIDTTEVSEAQYDAFLKDIGGGKGDAGPQTLNFCAVNNLDYTPGLPSVQDGTYVYDPVKNPNLPVRGVDWCDAYAYCRWAGKRLCERYDKTPAPDGTKDAGTWRMFETNITCSQNNLLQKYAYGQTYQAGVCPPSTLVDASYPPIGTTQCHGTAKPYSDVYDTSGSVAEWYGSCSNFGCATGGRDRLHQYSRRYGPVLPRHMAGCSLLRRLKGSKERNR